MRAALSIAATVGALIPLTTVGKAAILAVMEIDLLKTTTAMPTTPLPFHVSPEAEEYLKRVAVFRDKEAGISMASRITVCNRAGEQTDCQGLSF